jgi:peptidyl-prolyl cis-trans isomerase SurA
MTDLLNRARTALAVLAAAGCALAATAQTPPGRARTGDYIVAIVNQELVTAAELALRLARIREDAERNRQQLPPADALRSQVLDAMIDERVQVTHARESGTRIDDAELDRAVANVAAQNQITLEQLRERLRRDGVDFLRFRNNVRDQLLVERVREREVGGRIRISDEEIDRLVEQRRSASGRADELNLAQILVTVPEGASVAAVAERRARVDAAAARVRAGEAFEAVAREVSEDANRAQGGTIGLRSVDRLPDVFVEAVKPLKVGEMTAQPLRTGAGFHLLKLVERKDGSAFAVTQTRARHILLRPSPQLTQQAATARLVEFKRQLLAGQRTFEALARENSEDASAAQGGDLGWAGPGMFVPEFDEAMNALAIGGISDPVVSRFGVHLIQVVERRQVTLDTRQQREQARNVLREQKFDDAYTEWLRELRARAYVEMREPPQ